MNTLAIDIETYSSINLLDSGVYKYAQADDFEILLFAYSFDGEPANVVSLATGEPMPEKIIKALWDKSIIKTAYNAPFERTCLAAFLNEEMPAEQWQCTQVRAAVFGLPMNLGAVAKALKLEQQKDTAGKALIKYFCGPVKPTKANGERSRNLPEHAPDKWEEFKKYCAQDVNTEQAIHRKLGNLDLTDKERRLWILDQKINDTGVRIDGQLVYNAIQFDIKNIADLSERAKEITGLENPNSPAQLKKWVEQQTGLGVASLNKDLLPDLIDSVEDGNVREMLRIRQLSAKTSVKKYEAMAHAVRKGRVRGLLQFYGANRTGRWAGRLVQVQNLPRNEMPDLDLARDIVKRGDYETLSLMYDNIGDVLSQLVRTAFIPTQGSRFIVADFSAIEARVIAWLAGEKWRLDVFNTHGKIYEASAAHMFKVPIETITKGSPLRQKGKVAELALGYQGGPAALVAMGALRMGLTEDELPGLVSVWRESNPRIVKLWYDIQDAAITCVDSGKPTVCRYVTFSVNRNILFITLPSGRKLAYLRPGLKPNRFGATSLVYEGLEQTTKQWIIQETYGGKLVENIVQAIARDCLAEAMLRLDAAGYPIALHVHDEVVLDVPLDFGSTEEVNKIMSTPVEWAKGLPLTAESYETFYYKKD